MGVLSIKVLGSGEFYDEVSRDKVPDDAWK